MQLNIVNESSYKNLKIICNGKTYSLNKDNTITSLDIDNNTNVEIQVFEKNRVLLNLLFALVDGFVDGESVINSLVCDLSFDICETDDLQTLIIKDLEYRDDKNGYIYESVYIENINVSNLVYRLTNTAKTRKKALFYYVFIVSWLPVILALLGYYFLVKGNVLAILASILILLVFAIPSWKKASRVKKYYSNEFANEKYPNSICILKFFRINIERNTVTMHLQPQHAESVLRFRCLQTLQYSYYSSPRK